MHRIEIPPTPYNRADAVKEAKAQGAPRPARVWGALLVLLTESEQQFPSAETQRRAINQARALLVLPLGSVR